MLNPRVPAVVLLTALILFGLLGLAAIPADASIRSSWRPKPAVPLVEVCPIAYGFRGYRTRCFLTHRTG